MRCDLQMELLALASDSAVRLDVLLQRVVQAALAVGGSDAGAIIIFDPAEIEVSPVAWAVGGSTVVPLDRVVRRFIEAERGRLSRVSRTEQPDLIPNHEETPEEQTFTGHSRRSSVWVPLVERKRLMGLLVLESNQPGGLTESRIRDLEMIAREALPGLDRGLLREWLRQAAVPVEIVGVSRLFLDLERQTKLTGCFSDGPVLITGERGSGKELVAWAIHTWSRRRQRPFVPMLPSLCGGVLASDELFGHERHSFTGAEKARPGKLQAADGGTLFLDEVGDMRQTVQGAFLRVLERGELQRIGCDEPLHVDVRVLVATNRDLAALVTAERFRADLYDRLSFFEVNVPPLRERIEDIPVLARYFLRTYCRQTWRSSVFERNEGCSRCRLAARPPCATEAFFDTLQGYSWPGNVRELKHMIGRLVATVPDEVLDAKHLAEELRSATRLDARLSLEAVVKNHIVTVLKYSSYNQSQAARLLGLPLSTLRSKMKRLDIFLPPPHSRSAPFRNSCEMAQSAAIR